MISFLKRYWVVIVGLVLSVLFLYLRFFNLSNSFVFGGDPGRDMMVLADWRDSGKPPLLGPQTSAMPLNQSAYYFYILYPAFLVSGGSVFSPNITLAVFWLMFFWMGLWILRKDKLLTVWMFSFGMLFVYPLIVEQSRSVWNPSFGPPLLIGSLVSLYLYIQKQTRTRLLAFGLFSGLAVSLHFPIVVFPGAMIIYLFVFFRKLTVKPLTSFVAFMIWFNLPTLVFEIRHGFLITKSILNGGWLGTKQFTLLQNFDRFLDFVVMYDNQIFNVLRMILFVAIALVVIRARDKKTFRYLCYFTFLVGVVLMMASKMAIHSHYILGVVAVIACFVGTESWRYRLVFAFVGLIWVSPLTTTKYFVAAEMQVDKIEDCFQRICEREKEPMYVSVQSSKHNFHTGYEYRYLLKKNGCQVRNIDTQPDQAKLMSVILEDSNYYHGQTAFNELTLFGKSKEVGEYRCSEKLKLKLLTK